MVFLILGGVKDVTILRNLCVSPTNPQPRVKEVIRPISQETVFAVDTQQANKTSASH